MEYYIDKKEEKKYLDQYKRKFIIKWKNEEYSTYIDETYLKDKIITLNNLDDFFNSIFNKKNFYNFNVQYDFYFCSEKSVQLNIKLEIKINENLKTLKQDFIFILHKIDKRSWLRWFLDFILDRD
jgi:hypothetical protein